MQCAWLATRLGTNCNSVPLLRERYPEPRGNQQIVTLPALHREIVAGLGRPVIERGYIEAQREIFAWLATEGRARRLMA